jgi:hypothetical protein
MCLHNKSLGVVRKGQKMTELTHRTQHYASGHQAWPSTARESELASFDADLPTVLWPRVTRLGGLLWSPLWATLAEWETANPETCRVPDHRSPLSGTL